MKYHYSNLNIIDSISGVVATKPWFNKAKVKVKKNNSKKLIAVIQNFKYNIKYDNGKLSSIKVKPTREHKNYFKEPRGCFISMEFEKKKYFFNNKGAIRKVVEDDDTTLFIYKESLLHKKEFKNETFQRTTTYFYNENKLLIKKVIHSNSSYGKLTEKVFKFYY